MPVPIHFGTDGWRAVIAEEFTFANVRRVGQALVDYLRAHDLAGRGMVVGYDNRFASEEFAAAIAEVLAANGVPVLFCERTCPSPTVAYSVLPQHTAGAVIITASHNPSRYNGIKIKNEYAAAAPPEMVAEIEALLDRSPVRREPFAELEQKRLMTRFDPFPAYREQILRLVNTERIRQAGLTIIVDPMYGSGIGYLPALLEGGKTRVIEIHAERNPIFPGMKNPEPLAHNLTKLCTVVRDSGSHLGIALDGDADRVGLVDEKGRFVDPLRLFALLALYLLEVRGWRGPIVKSVNTTAMVEKLAARYSLPVFETPVGFKYVGAKMVQEDAILGGEESGGFGFRHHIPERDGILAALFLLDLVVQHKRTPSELIADLFELVGEHHYARLDLPCPEDCYRLLLLRLQREVPTTLLDLEVTPSLDERGYKYILSDGSWLLIRPSGTEPLLRIYAEAGSPERVTALLESG